MEGPDAGCADANGRWAAMLARWAIPDELRTAVRESPYFFDARVFTQAADEALARARDSPSDEVAREALPPDGSVLDVGCGAGAASLRLRPRRLTGVDADRALLDAFSRRAADLGLDADAVEGTWPEAAGRCAPADVVVCHHVVYNVPDLAAFARALDDHAGGRVVLELTAAHSAGWMAPYWLALHGLAQPDRPTADDVVEVLRELGLQVHARRWRRAYRMLGEHEPDAVARIARRLCLPPARHEELRLLLEEHPPPVERDVVTLWWDKDPPGAGPTRPAGAGAA